VQDQDTQTAMIMYFLTFVVGALAGAVAALLFAPVSGREMRKMIQEQAEGGWDTASAELNKARDQALAHQAETLEGVKKELGELQAKVQASTK
jgi:gas vesicle protein